MFWTCVGQQNGLGHGPKIGRRKAGEFIKQWTRKTIENGAIFGPKMAYKLHWKFLGWPGSRP